MPERPPQTSTPRRKTRAEVAVSPFFSRGRLLDDNPTISIEDETVEAHSEASHPRTPSPSKRKKAEVWISPYFEHKNPPRNARILCKDSEISKATTSQQTLDPASEPTWVESCVQDPACSKLYEELEHLKPILVQEKVAGDKWKLLVACIMLNVTSGKQALPVFWEMMERWPTPFAMSQVNKPDLVSMLSHLGLQDVRAERLISLSFEYMKDPPKEYDPRRSRVTISQKLSGQSTPRKRGDRRAEPSYPDTPVSHLPGSGRYALDSYRIFCTTHDNPLSTEWKAVRPTDKELIRYLKWKWAVQEHRQWSPVLGPGFPATPEYLEALKVDLSPPDTKVSTKSPNPEGALAPDTYVERPLASDTAGKTVVYKISLELGERHRLPTPPPQRRPSWPVSSRSSISKANLSSSAHIATIVPASYVERFLPLVLDIEEEGQQVTPCFSNQGVNYMHIRHSNLYLLALSKRNSNASEIIIFLHRLTQVLVEYFKELEEESIRDNFVIIYELMDEMMDFGFPQTTESKILQEYITQESHKLEVQVRPPMAVTNAVSWRTEGIRLTTWIAAPLKEDKVNANGNVVRSEILGAVKMKCYLSGMPELRLGLNDKVMFESTGRTARGKAIEMEDVKFHQCVRLSRFENDRTISFIPPDGEFELMSYRLSTPVKPLIWVEAAIESHKGSRVEYIVKVKAHFKRRSTANNVEIYVPVPDDADSPKFRAATGTVQYAPDKSAFIWKIKQLGGSREFLMRAHFGLPSVKAEQEMDKRAPITVKFEIPYFTVSGIQVRYLKIVEKSGYQALPWVRYITQNGDDYSLRTAQEKGGAPINPI
ncbi:hypothetical protein NMY22_g18084 [Coprinellus aureogranulatus]|nr:hypothetical protein NMY22_g18084 [Coprinellus aureogranulatus]